MWQIIPTIGTVLALAAFFFALYFRAIQKHAQIAIDGVRSVGQLPSRSRLDATKILVNVFDLDVKNLTLEQQFELAKKTFEKREMDSKRNFQLLLLSSLILIVFVTVYTLTNVNGKSMIKTAILIDKASAEEALKENGYFHEEDTDFVDQLASTVHLPKITDPFEQASAFSKIIQAQPAARELRERAEKQIAPFEAIGEIVNVTVPAKADQPKRFRVYVKRNSPLAGQILSISARGRNAKLRLLADNAIENSARSDIQLNYEQFRYLFGVNPNESRPAILERSTTNFVLDPVCPRGPNFAVSDCALAEKMDYRDLK